MLEPYGGPMDVVLIDGAAVEWFGVVAVVPSGSQRMPYRVEEGDDCHCTFDGFDRS